MMIPVIATLSPGLRDDVVVHLPWHVGGSTAYGRRGARRLGEEWTRAFGGLTVDVAEEWSAGDRAVLRGRLTGHHTGWFRDLPPTGRPVGVDFIAIARTDREGRVAEAWVDLDVMGLAMDLDGAPPYDIEGTAAAARWTVRATRSLLRSRADRPRGRDVPVRAAPRPPVGTERRAPAGEARIVLGAGTAQEQARADLLTRWVEEGVNGRRPEVFEEVFAPSYVGYAPPHAEPEPLRGPAGFARFIGGVIAGLPDLHMQLDEVVVDDCRAALRMTLRGTHRHLYRGLEPTYRSFTAGQTITCRFEGDQVVGSWQQIDAMGLMRQLGTVPPIDGGPWRLVGWFGALAGTYARLQATGAARR